MKDRISKHEASEAIDNFFSGSTLDSERVRKINRLAMKFNIKLGKYRTRFCKKCYGDLNNGKTRITKTHKKITCGNCGFVNKSTISWTETPWVIIRRCLTRPCGNNSVRDQDHREPFQALLLLVFGACSLPTSDLLASRMTCTWLVW